MVYNQEFKLLIQETREKNKFLKINTIDQEKKRKHKLISIN